jgi:hypothetical protein
MFPPRAPFFFRARLSQRAPQVGGAQPEDHVWGNLSVPPGPPPNGHPTESAG